MEWRKGREAEGRAGNEPPVRKLRHNPAERRGKHQYSRSLSSSRPGRAQTLVSSCKEYFPEGVAEDSLAGPEAGGRAPPGGPWRCAPVGAAEKIQDYAPRKIQKLGPGVCVGIFHLDPMPSPTSFHRESEQRERSLFSGQGATQMEGCKTSGVKSLTFSLMVINVPELSLSICSTGRGKMKEEEEKLYSFPPTRR